MATHGNEVVVLQSFVMLLNYNCNWGTLPFNKLLSMSSHEFVTADKFGKYGWPFLAPCLRIWLFFCSSLIWPHGRKEICQPWPYLWPPKQVCSIVYHVIKVTELIWHTLIQSLFLTHYVIPCVYLITSSTVYHYWRVYPSSNESFVLYTCYSSAFVS